MGRLVLKFAGLYMALGFSVEMEDFGRALAY